MKNVCSKCLVQNDCAANDWQLYDDENPKCPNYEEGMKQYQEFLEWYRNEKEKTKI